MEGPTPHSSHSVQPVTCCPVYLPSPTWKTQGLLGHPLGPLSASSRSSPTWTLWGQSLCVWGSPCGLRSASVTSVLLRLCVWMPAGQSEPMASPFPLLRPECFHQEHPHCTPALAPDSAEWCWLFVGMCKAHSLASTFGWLKIPDAGTGWGCLSHSDSEGADGHEPHLCPSWGGKPAGFAAPGLL